MPLSDRDVRTEPGVGRAVLDPYDPEMVQPTSIDVRLDRWFRLFSNHRYPVIDPAADQEELTHFVDVGVDKPFVLHPGELVLGATYERIILSNDVAIRLEDKSSLGRPGLLAHSTAGLVDPGFTEHVTLELSDTAVIPVRLWPGMKVGQLHFLRLSSPAQTPYGLDATGSRCQSQHGPTAFRSHQSFHCIHIPDTPAAPTDGVAPIFQEKHL